MDIKIGLDYLMDGITKVTVLKALNRAKTIFSVEIPGRGIDSVEGVRLAPVVQGATSNSGGLLNA
ncbi:MAG TPA: hypothetical protein VIH22_15115 [Cyclobacteriaceae bacterium]|jgi:hypothetical protein